MIIESDAGKEASAQIEGPFKTTTLMMKGVYLEGVCETSPEMMMMMMMMISTIYIYIYTNHCTYGYLYIYTLF